MANVISRRWPNFRRVGIITGNIEGFKAHIHDLFAEARRAVSDRVMGLLEEPIRVVNYNEQKCLLMDEFEVHGTVDFDAATMVVLVNHAQQSVRLVSPELCRRSPRLRVTIAAPLGQTSLILNINEDQLLDWIGRVHS